MANPDHHHSSHYLGPYETNFPRSPGKRTYTTRDGEEREITRVDVPGIVFGFLESTTLDAYLWVRIGNVELRAPVLVSHGRHTGYREDNKGKSFAPSETRFGDDEAAAILVDAIVANPEARDALGAMLRALRPRP